MTSLLLAHGDMVRDLGRAVVEGPRGLRGVQNLIVAVVREEAWRDFIAPGTGEHFTYGPDEFARFIAAPPFAGLGTNIATVQALCKEDAAALAALDRATLPLPKNGEIGRGRDSFRNAKAIPTEGQTRDYNLRRLKRDAPALAERVICGELSANAAAIEAGFRRRDTPLDALRRAWGKASDEERATFAAEIGE